MSYWRYIFCFFLMLHLSVILTNAQSNNYIGHIGSEDGLSSQLCTHLIEDDYGNLWISSYQDIQKYNGYAVTVFPTEERSGGRGDEIADLCKDGLGNIWVIQGELVSQPIDSFWNVYYEKSIISIINPLTDSVSAIADYLKSEEIHLENIVKVFQNKGKIFLGTLENEIYCYTDKLEFFASVRNLTNVLTITENEEIVFFENDYLSIKDTSGILKQELDIKELNDFQAFVVSTSGKIFILRQHNNKVSVYEYFEEKVQFLITVERKFFHQSSLKFSKIEIFKDGQLWINGKLFIKDENGKYINVKFRSTTSIHEYLISHSGLGYAATNLGVYVFNNKKQLFKKLANEDVNMNSVRGVFINEHIHAYKIFDKEVIVNRSDKYNLEFLNFFDLGEMALRHYSDPKNENHLWTTGLISVGIRKIDFEKEQIDLFTMDPQNPSYTNTILRSTITSKLYLSTESGPYVLEEEEKHFRGLEFDWVEDKTVVANHMIEKNGEIWIASSEGVIRYDELNNTSKVKRIFQDEESYFIQFMHEDLITPDIVWLGTRRGGLVKWNTINDSIQIFNTDHGLSNNDVHAIIEDNAERLWISTNRYLNCFHKIDNRISVFTEQDGLSHSEFNKHGYFYDKAENHIYFGGLNGYNYFNPDSIATTADNNKINVRIISASKTQNSGEYKNIFNDVIHSNSLDVYDEDVSFTVELSTNYLFDNEKAQYSYRIPDLLDEWKTQSSNEVKLNRLPYGKYKLELISDLNKPAHTSNVLSLDIHMVRPFTKSLAFYLLAALGFLFITWMIIQSYSKSLKERNLKLEKTISERTEELREVIKTKNKIFAILAHDLRNPISSLTNLNDKIKFLSKYNRIGELNLLAEQTNSRINALNDNLNNILLWALSENKMLSLKPEKLSLFLEIKKIISLYAHDIEEKELEVKLELKDVDQVYLDVSLLQTILRNFISNAIKFSYKKGLIIFSICDETEEEIVLEIKDNGIGIELENDNNQNLKNAEIRDKGKGSGIGLLISKELAQKAGVSLVIDSEISKGTVIHLSMPKQ